MRKLFILLVLTLFLYNQAIADHTMGGEISYKLIDTTTGKYRFTVKLYRNCFGISFGTEYLKIVKQGYSGTLAMTLVESGKEVTPIAYPPDVSTKTTTNCPYGPMSNGINGVDMWTYELEYTIGKNIGWAYVGWSSCCRNSIVTNGAAYGAYWIQTAVNTNYQNNSIVFTSPPITNWKAGVLNNYNFGISDKYDAKFININGKQIIRDSIGIQFYVPFQAEASNATAAFNLQNIPVSLNTGLTAQNFLYTSGGVTLNNSQGSMSCTPISSSQQAPNGLIVREFRAIPNGSGGYSRQLVGYVCRDLDVFVNSGGSSVNYHGIVAGDSISNSTSSVHTCKSSGIQFKFKVSSEAYKNIVVNDLSTIDNSLIDNYQFSKTITTGNFVDTALVTVTFNKKTNAAYHDFLFKAYNISTNTMINDFYIPIRVYFKEGGTGISVDTIYACSGGAPVRITANQAKNVVWSPKSNIVNFEPIDTSWIEVSPVANIKYYANNLSSIYQCKFSDSVYVKIDTCTSISGFLFLDSNSNCIKNTNEQVLKNIILKFRGVGSSFAKDVTTDNIGFYSVSCPQNSNMTVESDSLFFNCGTSLTKFPVSIANTSITKNISVKDSCHSVSKIFLKVDSSVCVKDTLLLISNFSKGLGTLKAVITFDNGDSTIVIPNSLPDSFNISKLLTYRMAGKHPLIVRWFNKRNIMFRSDTLAMISASSCLFGQVYLDIDNNCQYSSAIDELVHYSSIAFLNQSTSQSKQLFTDYDGKFGTKFDASASHTATFFKNLNCNSNSSVYNLPATADTVYRLKFPIDTANLNYKINLQINTVVNNTNPTLLVLSSNRYDKLPKSKIYTVDVPYKGTLDTVFYAQSFSLSNGKITINKHDSTGQTVVVRFTFDSLVSTDTIKFKAKLGRVGSETDTTDNSIALCRKAFTSFDPNNKVTAIESILKNGDFTNKSDDIVYTINFQNTGNAAAKRVLLIDTFETKLDANSISIEGSSHPMQPMMDEDNRTVKFEFNNINLIDSITDPESSKGFVSFRMKAKTTLQLNEVIANKVAIYFDYNDPVITNTTLNRYVLKSIDTSSSGGGSSGGGSIDSTRGKDSTLAIHSMTHSQFLLYPNPVYHILNISLGGQSPYQIALYSLDGKKVYSGQNTKQIDVSKFERGTYIVQFISEKEKITQKIQLE